MTQQPSRIGIYLDLENLLHAFRDVADWRGAVTVAQRLLHEVASLGTVVTAVASCDLALWNIIAFPLDELGVRVFPHAGGDDAADRELLARLHGEVPASVDTVVIGSGDHIFTPAVRELQRTGRRVIVAVSDVRDLARELRLTADATRVFMYPAPLSVAA